MLTIISERVEFFPKVDKGSKSKGAGKSNSDLLLQALVKCLSSAQSETRAIAEDILKDSVRYRIINISSAEKAFSKLSNAEQRKIRPLLDRLGSIQIEETSLDPLSNRAMEPRPASTVPFRNKAVNQNGHVRPKSTTPFERVTKDSPSRTSKASSRPSTRTGDRSSIHRKRSVSRGQRESGSRQGSEYSGGLADLLSDPVFHPFKSETAVSVSKAYRVSKQRDYLPEYPEEPSGKDIFSDLKKTWSLILPHSSVEFLFPKSGIRVQDDASPGCELLSRGIEMVLENGDEDVVLNQIDLVIRWYAYALCSRETTKGMQSLMSFLMKLATLLRNQKYQLSDSESFMLFPYLLEKAGAAKVRYMNSCHASHI